MRIFFDSSALTKRYIAEPGSEIVIGLCEGAEDIILSFLCPLEMIATLNRLRREKRLTALEYKTLKNEINDDIAQATVIDPTPYILQHTITILEDFQVKTLDAIHIASAKIAACDIFVTADKQQSHAAKSIGMKVRLI